MLEGTDSVFNTVLVPSNISYKSFKTYNLPMENSYCDDRNVDSENQPQAYGTTLRRPQEI